MEKDEKKKYNLYLFAMNDDNAKEAMKYRFNRINGKYILVYSDAIYSPLKKSRYHIIEGEEAKLLTDSEKVWLLEANVKIITEESMKNQDEIMKSFEERLSILEKELEKESQKAESSIEQEENGK